MEWRNYAVYNRPMSQSRTTTGILTIIVLAVIGYILVTIPPRLFEGDHHAAEVHAWMGYAYLGVVGFGSLLLGGLVLAILLHVLKNTRQKAADHERRSPQHQSPQTQASWTGRCVDIPDPCSRPADALQEG